MNEELIKNEDVCYQVANQKAEDYFRTLYNQVLHKTYIPDLSNTFQSWQRTHIPKFSLVSFFSRKKGESDSKGYHHYIKWLDQSGKLDRYLERSIAYLYMRDLGKPLDSTNTQTKVLKSVEQVKKHLRTSTASNEGETDPFSMVWLYRQAQKFGLESTFFWLIDKLKTVAIQIPEGMSAEEAQRKLIKIIAGVLMHTVEEMDDKLSYEERAERLEEGIRLGYAYGLTYPFIDDLLDSNVLSVNEKNQYTSLIRMTLLTGSVPELGEWDGDNIQLINYIHSELREAFEYIKAHQRPETLNIFFEQSYVFFHSQELDRIKDLSNANYTNEELYIPLMIKSSSSRLIVRSLMGVPEDEGFNKRIFYYGIYNQLADDFADMYEDMKAGAVTPYTYYLKYHHQREDLINPFEFYWTVISHLIHHVFHSDSKTCDVILKRAINGLKRYKARMGTEKYNEVMALFAPPNPKFNQILQYMVRKADDVDFFDKLLRDQMINHLKTERVKQQAFFNTIKTVRHQINNILAISKNENAYFVKEPIVEAANYSLEGNGKRLRPIMTWVMGVNEYGLDSEAIIPLLRSLEYMHTASLIFDDLPSQDNSPTRRGRPTLHQVYNTATAELTGLFLTQKAVEEQASLHRFDAKTVLKVIHYSAQATGLVCQGQAMDLNAKGKPLTLEQLNMMCFYKTGIAFEASLIMPAILAGAEDIEIDALKKYARHTGIAFQIKDDLLDVEGDKAILGKPSGKDAENNNSTFVSILGREGAKKEMWNHYCRANEALRVLHSKTAFLKHLLNYIVHRDH